MHSDSQNQLPALRFRDDQGDEYPNWDEQKFTALATKISDNYKPVDTEQIICIELENIVSNSGRLSGSTTTFGRKSTKTKFRAGDVLFGKLRPYLNKYYLTDFDGVCTTEIWVLRPISVASEFLYLVVQGERFLRVANYQFGSKMPRSDWKLVSESTIYLPKSSKEQRKIASFLSSVDRRIEQLERKRSLLAEYRKGMMQKLFSREIRFRDEQGKEYPEWTTTTLNDVAKFCKGKGISINDVDVNGNVKCIRYGELYTNYGETIKSVTSCTNLSPAELVLSKNNDVIIPSSGETALDMASASCVLLDDVALGGDLIIIRSNLNGIFLAYCLNYMKREIARLAQGVSVVHLYASQIQQLRLPIPHIEEQEKIARFLVSIDEKVELVSEQIEKTREFKRGLLQQMFV